MVRLPITIAPGNCFTLTLSVGSGNAPVNVLLDTGSSMTAVTLELYDPGADANASTTQLLQNGSFQGVTFIAAVVRTRLGLRAGQAVPQGNLGVIYNVRPYLFAHADGILGLAYPGLNSATRMPDNTWEQQYGPADLELGQPAGNLATCLDQFVAAGGGIDKFAFSVQRSIASEAADSSLNSGTFVLGGGEECTDLYTGAFSSVAVVHEAYYHTNLMSIQVGNGTVQVPPIVQGDPAASNSFIDSGSGGLMLDPNLYRHVIELYNAVNPAFGAALQSGSRPQAELALADWPDLRFVLQGTNGTNVTLTVTPRDYWQFDGYGAGTARSGLTSGGAPHPGQSILGLPLFAGHYVVFDRTGGAGKGMIKFAARPETAQLVA